MEFMVLPEKHHEEVIRHCCIEHFICCQKVKQKKRKRLCAMVQQKEGLIICATVQLKKRNQILKNNRDTLVSR